MASRRGAHAGSPMKALRRAPDQTVTASHGVSTCSRALRQRETRCIGADSGQYLSVNDTNEAKLGDIA